MRNIEPDNALELGRSRIVNQAASDFSDLLYDSFAGRGRPAAQRLEVPFEHLVNLRTSTTESNEASMFREHAAIDD